ncbi:unnamed protein product [Peronospora farinosa]|uniref:Protein kinase domain-containing protein n=1 Tax=Peronospora farinosa TaxID=134698 RepID=A0AAV0SUE6_9STRA|nr:unnamed protein product [Peronospora farinosa]CAI5707364.1 unnamed protein product [Peronospora farinosa]
MERRRRVENTMGRHRRSRSFSPVSSRLRYHLRRHHMRPPPGPSSMHRRPRSRRSTIEPDYDDKKNKRSRSFSPHDRRSTRRRTGAVKQEAFFDTQEHHEVDPDPDPIEDIPALDPVLVQMVAIVVTVATIVGRCDHHEARARQEDDVIVPRLSTTIVGVAHHVVKTNNDDVIRTTNGNNYAGKPGEYIANRYKIIREAGLGTFGRVLECLDKQRNIVVAIKVVRKVDKYTESAKIEAAILQDVNDKDKNNESLCVRMFKWFEYKGHVCMVFERLGCSLYDYLKNHDYKPFPMHCIRAYAWQLLTSLEFIHSIRLIHTDLKPENILLVDDEEERLSCDSSSPSSTSSFGSPGGSSGREQWSNGRQWKKRERAISDVDTGRLSLRPPASNAVKLIDFGGATYEDESKSSIINTRQYRSPEVILGLGWSYPSDIWSAGCIIAELYLGELLFATHENLEHLALMERCIGPLPVKMKAQASKHSVSSKFFHRGRLNWPAGSSSDESVDHVRRMRLLADLISREDAKSGLLELLQLMLVLDPENRVTAKEALNTPFFDEFSYRNIVRAGHRDRS